MSWLERETGGQQDIVTRGQCFLCDRYYGARDLAICLGDVHELASAQKRIAIHMSAVYHLDAPSLAW